VCDDRLALLCYLGRCETPESPFYGDNVMKGIMYLIELGKKNPHGIFSEAWKGKSTAVAAVAPTSTASPLTPSARCTPWPVWAPNHFPACVRPLKKV
jgi:hypothetical protein